MSTATLPEREVAAPCASDFSLAVARSVLKDAITTLAAVTSSKSHLPITGCVRVEVRDGSAVLTGTNFDTTLTLTIPVQSTRTGVACIPAKRLADILSNLVDAPVTIAFSAKAARVTSGRSKFDVPTMDKSEFPVMPEVGLDRRAFDVPASLFVAQASRAVRMSFTAEPGKGGFEVYRSMCLDATPDGLMAVASNTHAFLRLGMGDTPQDFAGTQSLIPNDAIAGLARLFSGLKDDATIAIRSDEHRISLVSAGRSAVLSLRSGTFPPYVRIIPTGGAHRLVVSREQLAAAIRRVSITTDHSGRVRFTLDGSLDLLLSAADGDGGTSEDALRVESYDGPAADEPFRIEAKAALLLLSLDALDSESVEVAMHTPRDPIAFRPAGQAHTAPDIAIVQPLIIL